MSKSKLLLLLAFVMLVSAVFVGCDQIPEEYTEGVKLDKSYPDEDMPIYDDAVVYYCDDDENEISIKYGVEDDLDDVADFYKDHFEDIEIELEDETDKSSRYSAEGSYKDFQFKVKVTEPSGDYEEKVFTTIVKVDIEFIDDSLGTVSDIQNKVSLSDQLPGFWRQESFEDSSGSISTYEYGTAYEFYIDGTLNIYFNFALIGTGGWSEIDSSTVLLTTVDGTQENVKVTFEKRSEKEYLIWEDSTGKLVFFKDSKDEFSMETADNTPVDNTDGDNTGSTNTSTDIPVLDDSQLTSAISGTTWYYIAYVDKNGNTQSNSEGKLIYNADGSFEDAFDEETETGSWYVTGGRLYCDYSDDTSSNWQISVLLRGSAEYLLYFDDEEAGAFWLYSTFPLDSIITYTTDEEMTAAIAGRDFNALYYMYANGATETMSDNPITFSTDHTLQDLYEGELLTGTWEFKDGYLTNTYDNGDAFQYPVYVEYNTVSDSYYLFLGDLEEGFEDCYWIYTTYQP